LKWFALEILEKNFFISNLKKFVYKKAENYVHRGIVQAWGLIRMAFFNF